MILTTTTHYTNCLLSTWHYHGVVGSCPSKIVDIVDELYLYFIHFMYKICIQLIIDIYICLSIIKYMYISHTYICMFLYYLINLIDICYRLNDRIIISLLEKQNTVPQKCNDGVSV